jgi:ketosteroid isomerase-like protein
MVDLEFKEVVERFLAASDRGDADALSATYSPDFLNIRVADDGGLASLTGAQILTILQATKGRNHSAPAGETVIHSAEVAGDLGYVAMTRMKDHGNGWEPTFYSLVWALVWGNAGGKWLLLREFVHQRSFPRLSFA